MFPCFRSFHGTYYWGRIERNSSVKIVKVCNLGIVFFRRAGKHYLARKRFAKHVMSTLVRVSLLGGKHSGGDVVMTRATLKFKALFRGLAQG